MNFKQTWWNKNVPTRKEEFYKWVGDSKAESKVFFRDYIKKYNFKNILDVGCGPATEFDGFKAHGIDSEYTGVDSCEYLYEQNRAKNIPMILSEAENIPVQNSSYELVFARHVLEHQISYKEVLNEMIRCSKKLVAHIFFIKPSETEQINFDEAENVYHNLFNKNEIESFLSNHPKIKNFEWQDINENENILLAWIKS